MTGKEPTHLTPSDPPKLLDALFTTDEIRAVFSDRRFLEHMLEFELALAKSLVQVGIAPATAIPPLEASCDAARFDPVELARQASLAGNIAIPFVKALTSFVASTDHRAAKFVHWGATSQDVLDTALVLQLREGLGWFESKLSALSDALAALTEKHKTTVLAGRTWLQQGPPVTLGLKAAGWLSAIERHRVRLRETAKQVAVVQFGGAVGTLAALGDQGPDVAAALADELKIEVPDLPWHTHRDRIAAVATSLGLLTGTLGKIARDVSLLMQTEVDEASEPTEPGRGGSSTMPHKRNPVGSAVVLAAATRVPALVSTMLAAMVQEHERGLGGWHAEWETLPQICLLAAGALERTLDIVGGLEIHETQMVQNLEKTHGLILAEAVTTALAKHVGRLAAHERVEEACRRAIKDNRHLRDMLLEEPEIQKHLSAEEIDRLLDPRNYLGATERLVERALFRRAKGTM